MSSNYKTDFLGLNHWTEEDRPKRIDFVEDNLKIDLALKEHLEDDLSHVTKEEKEIWAEGSKKERGGFFIGKYSGTGGKKTILLERSPMFILVFSGRRVPINYIEMLKKTATFFGFATQDIGSGGIILNESQLTIESSNNPNEYPDVYKLNDVGLEYSYVGFYN